MNFMNFLPGRTKVEQSNAQLSVIQSAYNTEVHVGLGRFPADIEHVKQALALANIAKSDHGGLLRFSVDIYLNENDYNQISFDDEGLLAAACQKIADAIQAAEDFPLSVKAFCAGDSNSQKVEEGGLKLRWGLNVYHPSNGEQKLFDLLYQPDFAAGEPIVSVYESQRGAVLDRFVFTTVGHNRLADAIDDAVVKIRLDGDSYRIYAPKPLKATVKQDVLTVELHDAAVHFRIQRYSKSLLKPQKIEVEKHLPASLPSKVTAAMISEPITDKPQRIEPHFESELPKNHQAFVKKPASQPQEIMSEGLPENLSLPAETFLLTQKRNSLSGALETFKLQAPPKNEVKITLECIVVAGSQVENRGLMITEEKGTLSRITHADLVNHGATTLLNTPESWTLYLKSGAVMGRQARGFADTVDQQAHVTHLTEASRASQTGLSRALSRKHFMVIRDGNGIFIEPSKEEALLKPLYIMSPNSLKEVTGLTKVEAGDYVVAGLFLFKLQPAN